MATPQIPPQVLQELQAWAARRQQMLAAYRANPELFRQNPSLGDEFNGKGLSPQAYQYAHNYANGQPYFNPDTGSVGTAGSIWKSPETWAQIGLAGGLVAAPIAAGMAAGAAGSSAGAGGGAAALGPSTAANMAATSAASAAPAGIAASGTGAAAGTGAATGFLGSQTARTAAAAIPAVFSLFKGGSANSENALTPDQQQMLTQLLQLQLGRAQSQDPVHQAAMAMALHLAPSYARPATATSAATPPRLPPIPGMG